MPNEPESAGPSDPPPHVPSGPLEIAPDCWMVGHRNLESILQCNTYLRTLRSDAAAYHLCIDPGSQYDFSVIEGNISRLIGGLSEVNGMTINHDGSDVVGNVAYFCEANPRVDVFTSEDVWRLLQHLLFKPGHLRLVNAACCEHVLIAPHHRLELVPTPFCHFRGAMAFYDPEIRTLFSGDLFGGFNRVGTVHLVAKEEDWPGIAQFHQIYMPTREVLRHAVREVLSLHPPVRVIAPHHGHIVTGNLVSEFLDRMYDLKVGQDLLASSWEHENLEEYRQVILHLISRAELTLGGEEVYRRLVATDPDDQLDGLLHFRGNDIQLHRNGYSAVVKVFARLARHQRLETVVALRSLILNACSDRGLAIPPVGAGLDIDGSDPPIST